MLIFCVVSDISWHELKVSLGVFIIILVSHVGHSPNTLTVGWWWQVRVHPAKDTIIEWVLNNKTAYLN